MRNGSDTAQRRFAVALGGAPLLAAAWCLPSGLRALVAAPLLSPLPRSGPLPHSAAVATTPEIASAVGQEGQRGGAWWAGPAVCGAVMLTLRALPRHWGRTPQRRSWRLHGCRGLSAVARAVAPTAAPVTAPAATTPSGAWTGDRVRQAFVDFFVQRKEHDFVASSPVVPFNDPTLLFANAGMNQFKAIFMGQLEPTSPLQGVRRAANSQKCIRAGGKHNDLDDVGRDSYHHTFFEMLGNWSFGDYFKTEAIDFAWELLINVYGLKPERVYASYFGGDEGLGLPPDLEAKALWERYLPPSRVLPFGKGDNFWEMGAVGPCGPCSELHYDRIGGRDAAALVNADDPDVIEIWNLVFMQFYRDDTGALSELPSQHIDTGMGFERITSILQDVRSNYDTDVFAPLLAAVHAQVGGEPYRGRLGVEDENLRDTAYRVIADHARTLTFAVADGAVPSSEGRGYVLRRILRRAVRYGRQMLAAPPGFFSGLVDVVVDSMGSAYPELKGSAPRVKAVLREEEQAFDRTVERGMQYFTELRAELAETGAQVVPGERAFLLYDTHGFPLDLTQQMAEEAGFSVDIPAFEAAMERQKERSRDALREQQALEQGMRPLELVAEQTAWLEGQGVTATEDAQKYEWGIRPTARVRAIFSEKGFLESTGDLDDKTTVGIVLDRTPFYAEAGGQTSDVGELMQATAERGTALLSVRSVQVFGGFILHSGLVPKGAAPLSVGEELACEVDYAHRSKVAPNHTMTHTLNWALREVLGEGVDQRGSLVTAERLRFDFSSDAVTTAQLQRVEDLVQGIVEAGLPVTAQEVSLAEARGIAGLRAMAGESYPDPVRVVTIGAGTMGEILAAPGDARWLSQSVEFCGGTHISDSAEAGAFAVLEERAIAKGIRRIVAATGAVAEAARSEGARLSGRLAELEAQASPVEAEVAEFGRTLDAAETSAALKAGCRERLEDLRKRLKKKQKGASKEAVAAARVAIQEAVAAATAEGAGHCIVLLEGLDAKALNQAVPDAEVAVLALARNSGGAVYCVATLPASHQAEGFKAGAWVQTTLAALGGRGGGKPGRAQGSAPEGDEAGIASAEAAAAAYWSQAA